MNGEYIGFAGLWAQLAAGAEMKDLGPQLEARLAANPSDAGVLMDLAILSFLTFDPVHRRAAFDRQAQALRAQQIYRVAGPHAAPGLRLLAIMAPGDMTANTPVDCLLYGSDVAITAVYASAELPLPARLPEHDLVFVAAGQSEANDALLGRLEAFAAASPTPVLNRPQRIRALTRPLVAAALRGIPGVLIPDTARVSRQALLSAQRSGDMSALIRGGRYPILVRPVDSHGGKNLARVETAAQLQTLLQQQPDEEFFVSNFIDYRAADGLYYKWRLALVDGRPFVCHVAISSDWMIHYVNAGMHDSADKRTAEARLMDGFEAAFLPRHAGALAAINQRLGLDYVGLDCAETRDGQLLIFEADSANLAHAFDDPELFGYKIPHMQKLLAAFRALLKRRAAGG